MAGVIKDLCMPLFCRREPALSARIRPCMSYRLLIVCQARPCRLAATIDMVSSVLTSAGQIKTSNLTSTDVRGQEEDSAGLANATSFPDLRPPHRICLCFSNEIRL